MRKSLWWSWGSLLVMSFMLGCALEGAPSADSDRAVAIRETALTPGAPVRLLFAQTESSCVAYTTVGSCVNGVAQGKVKGYIEIDNLAYNKRVVVRYEGPNGLWKDAEASYAGRSGGSAEAWYFETLPKQYPDRLGTEVAFAIKYAVNGREHWDNNGGVNYVIGAGPRTLAPTKLVEAAALTLTYAAFTDNPARFTGQVALKNLAYTKDVRVVYTTDGWVSTKEAALKFDFAGSGYESWSFAVDNLSAAVGSVDFVLKYTAHGVVYWDNNFRRDYRVKRGAAPLTTAGSD